MLLRIHIAAIGALAFISACISHETLGHGGACLAIGSRITVLSSVYFRCADGGVITDAAGPLMSLAMGAVFWVLLRSRTYSTGWQLFLTLAMAFHLLWGAGYFIFSAITNRGDWAFVLRQLAVEPRWLWRCLMGILGCYL